VIYISSNKVKHPVTKTFTTLHQTTLNSTSLQLSTLHFLPFKLHPNTLHYPLISLNTIQISYRSNSPNIATLQFIRPGDMAPAICAPLLYFTLMWSMSVRRLGLLLQCLAEAADVSDVSPHREITNFEIYVVISRCIFKEIHIWLRHLGYYAVSTCKRDKASLPWMNVDGVGVWLHLFLTLDPDGGEGLHAPAGL